MPTCSWFLAAARTMVGAADVDELHRGVRGERVQVGDHQVDGLDPIRLQVRQVLGLGAIGQDPAVDLRVEGLDPAAEHLGRARHRGHLDVRDTRLGQCRRRVPARHKLPAEAGQPTGQLDQAVLVVNRQQRPHGTMTSLTPSGRLREAHARWQIPRPEAIVAHRRPPIRVLPPTCPSPIGNLVAAWSLVAAWFCPVASLGAPIPSMPPRGLRGRPHMFQGRRSGHSKSASLCGSNQDRSSAAASAVSSHAGWR